MKRFFILEEGRVRPSRESLPEGNSAEIVLLWDRVTEISRLLPPPVDTDGRGRIAADLCASLNSAAAGQDYVAANAALDGIEADVQREHRSWRRRLRWMAEAELVATLLAALLVLLVYMALRDTDFVQRGVIWDGYARNILQNMIGGIGWTSLGFCAGLALRRTLEAWRQPLSTLVQEAARRPSPLIAALGNVTLVAGLFLSIYFGVALVSVSGAGWEQLEVPRRGLLPGALLGLWAPRIVKTLFG